MISNKQAYYLLLLERACMKHRNECSKDCSKCQYQNSSNLAEAAVSYAIGILKARDPLLYLQDEIQDLKELLEANQSV